ncbi:tyrosine recombinase XerC [Streptosporangium canum]|uniref:site-specific integrase n=1 Tax=Streptosporangium canum TaxID=324952 RepID=UPI0036800456
MAKPAPATPEEEPRRSRKRKPAKRRFGRIRQLPSGRFQARYTGPDGVDRPAPETFATKTDAEVWLTRKEAEILDDEWIDPDAGKITLREYGRDWIDERPNLRLRTVELYGYLLRVHLVPTFGDKALSEIKDPHVRRWRKKLLDTGVSEVTVAKAYRLLKAILTTAVDDQFIKRNPCRIKGAGQERSPERPVLTVAQLYKLADTIEPRYRALVLLGTFGSLRWGEPAGLQRRALDLDAGTVRVERQLMQLTGKGPVFTEPKSAAGKRTVVVPEHRQSLVVPGSHVLILDLPQCSRLYETGRGLHHEQLHECLHRPSLSDVEARLQVNVEMKSDQHEDGRAGARAGA